MRDIETFIYEDITLHLFLNPSTDKYDIVLWSEKTLTRYINHGIESIYEAGSLFMRYKLDILRYGHEAIDEGV
jgi:hypothetical protein